MNLCLQACSEYWELVCKRQVLLRGMVADGIADMRCQGLRQGIQKGYTLAGSGKDEDEG